MIDRAVFVNGARRRVLPKLQLRNVQAAGLWNARGPTLLKWEVCGATHVFARDGVDDIIGWGTEKLGDDGELVDMVLSGEQGLAFQHLSENASGAPDIHLNIVLLPSKHNLGCSVVPRRHVASHLWVLDAGESKVAYLEIAVLVYENVGWLQVSVNNTGRVDILEASL